MKKILFIALALATATTQAQVYGTMAVHSQGVQLGGGVLVEKIDLSINYDIPLNSAVRPKNLSVTVGKQFLLTNHDEDNYSLTASIGGARVKYKDLSKYETGGEIVNVNEIKPVYNLELGKDAYMGRVFIFGKYVTRFYAGIGIKFFMGRD